MVDARQHAVQTSRRTYNQGEKIYRQEVIGEQGSLVARGHLDDHKYDRLMSIKSIEWENIPVKGR